MVIIEILLDAAKVQQIFAFTPPFYVINVNII